LHSLIRQYYEFYNARRFHDAAGLFASDAVIEHAPYGSPPRHGGDGYVESAELSVSAFPDARVEVLRIEQHGQTTYEVDLLASGTHSGTLDMGTYGRFAPTGKAIHLRHRELLEIRDGKIVYASVTFDAQELLEQVKPLPGR
jgi:predicted ester cyclase